LVSDINPYLFLALNSSIKYGFVSVWMGTSTIIYWWAVDHDGICQFLRHHTECGRDSGPSISSLEQAPPTQTIQGNVQISTNLKTENTNIWYHKCAVLCQCTRNVDKI
jgi:hypothetical protein